MAKKFMYVCLGVLALAVAYHLGAERGRASIVDHSTTGVIGHQSNIVLLDNGETWIHYGDEREWGLTECQLPVPVSEVKFWQGHTLITNGNDLWECSSGVWTNRGTPPGGVVTEPSTWGSMKAKWKGDK